MCNYSISGRKYLRLPKLLLNNNPVSALIAKKVINTPSPRRNGLHLHFSPHLRLRKCKALDFNHYRETIEKFFSISFTTEVLYNNEVIGKMYEDIRGNIKLKSVNCSPANSNTCNACQRVVKLLNRLKVRAKQNEREESNVDIKDPEARVDDFALAENRVNNPICKWIPCGCNRKQISVRALISHVMEQISRQPDVAPIKKQYTCKWKDCNYSTTTIKYLRSHLKDRHTGKDKHSLRFDMNFNNYDGYKPC